jgi:hypothetical protein
MAHERERSAIDKETLIFQTPDEARAWEEKVESRLEHERLGPVSRGRDVVAQALVEEFERQGEGVRVIAHPWEHTPAEHREVQDLVDVSFRKDLGAAIAHARRSEHYPRNLDLFHDVLTGELYKLVRERKLNRQTWRTSLVALGVAVILTLLVCLVWLNR